MNKLREIRNEQKLAGWGLATRAGISPSLVTAIEKWGHIPRLETKARIAGALGVEIAEIWPADDSQPVAQGAAPAGGVVAR